MLETSLKDLFFLSYFSVEVANKIETESVSPELCKRLKTPLQQLLLILHSGRVLASEELDQYQQQNHQSSNLQTECSHCGRVITPIGASRLPQLLGLSPRLTTVISEAIDSASVDSSADPLCVARLVHTPEWTSAYKTLCKTMETLYLPAYMESPEYLGRVGATSTISSPGYQFIPADVTADIDMANTLELLTMMLPYNSLKLQLRSVLTIRNYIDFMFFKDFLDSNLSRRFYKSSKQSSSFNDINELSRREFASRAKSVAKDDMSTTSASRRSGRLRSRRRPTSPSPMKSAKMTEEDLDFSKWRVSIPFYTSASRSSTSSLGGRGNFKSSSASSVAAGPMMLTLMMNPEQPDFSLFSFTAPSQGYYTVIAEREISGKTVSSRVRRKYAEFYVLEQRLVEFHGSLISHRLHARRYGAQSHHFLENMKSYFERFLRVSDLTQFSLHPFQWRARRKSQLSDPLCATPDSAIDSCRISCQPSPFYLFGYDLGKNESEVEDSFLFQYLLTQPFLRTSELMYTFLTSPNVEFTSNNLADIRLGKFVKSMPILLAKEKGQFTDKFLTAFRSSCFALPTQKMGSTVNHHHVESHSSHSILEHRLRSTLYWNNAGIPILQRRASGSECCAMEGSYVTSFYDFFGYLVDNFRKPEPKGLSNTEQQAPMRCLDSTTGKFSVYMDFLQWLQRMALTCWSVLKILW
ncbi:unnamed protein product [Hydatigera taeniaeformis]|uniref:PX domain-containing protein n=1 Tax=Hydatigena taeniaeformis TaxID=6205 RepID=A0A0R3WLK5_HYDTA|nr:unnamed protein product [Hydatigera taeniaeformis]